MGFTPIPPPPLPIEERSEEKLRATIDLFRFDRRERNRRLAHAARDELIRRAELECGLAETPRSWQSRVLAAPPKPDDALRSVMPV